MTIEAQKQNYDVPTEILKTAKERADYSKNYLAKIKKSPEDFAKEVYAVFGIKFDAATNEGLTRGVFELQKKLSMNAKSCDAKLGKNTYGMYVNKIGTQFSEFKDRLFSAKDTVENGLSDASKGAASIIGRAFGKVPVLTDKAKEENEVKFEKRVFDVFFDSNTKYKVVMFVPEGADGSVEVFFNGNDVSVDDSRLIMKIPDYLEKKWKTGKRPIYAMLVGKDKGHSDDKYSVLTKRYVDNGEKKSAFSLILCYIERNSGVQAKSRDVVISGWSRGGSALRNILAQNDPSLARVKAVNNYDGVYMQSTINAMANFARAHKDCQVNLAYQISAASGTMKYGNDFKEMTKGLINVDVRAVRDLFHSEIAEQFLRKFAGLPPTKELTNRQLGIENAPQPPNV